MPGILPPLLSTMTTPLYPAVASQSVPYIAATISSMLCDTPTWLVLGPTACQAPPDEVYWDLVRRRTKAGRPVSHRIIPLLCCYWLDAKSISAAASTCRAWWSFLQGYTARGRQRVVVLPRKVAAKPACGEMEMPMNRCVKPQQQPPAALRALLTLPAHVCAVVGRPGAYLWALQRAAKLAEPQSIERLCSATATLNVAFVESLGANIYNLLKVRAVPCCVARFARRCSPLVVRRQQYPTRQFSWQTVETTAPSRQYFEVSTFLVNTLASISWFPELLARSDVRQHLTLAARRMVHFWKEQDRIATAIGKRFSPDIVPPPCWAQLARSEDEVRWREYEAVYGKHVRCRSVHVCLLFHLGALTHMWCAA